LTAGTDKELLLMMSYGSEKPPPQPLRQTKGFTGCTIYEGTTLALTIFVIALGATKAMKQPPDGNIRPEKVQGASPRETPQTSTQEIAQDSNPQETPGTFTPKTVQGSGPVEASPKSSRERLEEEKLRIEIENLQRWWLPAAPGLLTLFAAIVGVVVAAVTGLFDARRLKLEGETAKLEARKLELQREVALASVDALSQRIGAVKEINVPAVEELIAQLERNRQQKGSDVDFLTTLIEKGDTPVLARGLLLYCLYHGANDSESFEKLLEWAKNELPALPPAEQRRGVVILGQDRWSKADRPALAAVLHRLIFTTRPDLRTQAIVEVGRLHRDAWDVRAGRDKFRLVESDANLFFDILVRARDLALDPNENVQRRREIMQALVDIAPPAVLAIAADLMAPPGSDLEYATPQGDRNAIDFGYTLLAAVRQVDKISPGYQPPLMEANEDHYDDMAPRHWIPWKERLPDFMRLMMEPNLATMRADPERFKQFLYFYEKGG
jgi:hypothetical protein